MPSTLAESSLVGAISLRHHNVRRSIVVIVGDSIQEMLDFHADKNVMPDVELIRIDEINDAFDRQERSDVRYRFVINMASMPTSRFAT